MEKTSLNSPIYEYFNDIYNRDCTADSAIFCINCTVRSAIRITYEQYCVAQYLNSKVFFLTDIAAPLTRDKADTV